MSVVLITGCSSGFGQLAALAFGRRGDRVYATMRDPSRDETVASTAKAEQLDVEVLALDVADDASVRSGIAQILEREGRLDVVVNNAGVGGSAKPIELLTDDDWLAVLSTNLLGCARVVRAALPSMREQRGGTIVNISSLGGRMPGTPTTAPYAASKHALCSFSDSLLSEVEEFGIDVVCIEPGFFATSIVDKSTFNDLSGTPYEHLARTMEGYYRTNVANGADPAVVADEIVHAVDEPKGDSIHRPVGADAELLLATQESMTYAEFHAAARQVIGLG